MSESTVVKSITREGVTVEVTEQDLATIVWRPIRPMSNGKKRPFTMRHLPGCGHFKSFETGAPDFEVTEFAVITVAEQAKGRKACESCAYSVALRRETERRIDGQPVVIDGKPNKSKLFGQWTVAQATVKAKA